MSRNLILIAFAIFLVQSSYSQEEILLKGKLFSNSLDDSSVHIINLTAGTGTVNSSSGSFEIKVKENDILLISSVQFVNEEIIISREIYKTEKLEVTLMEDVNELAEVKLRNIGLTGNLNTDVASLDIVKDMPVNINFGDIKYSRFEADINDPQAAPDNIAFQQNQVMSHPGAASVDLLATANLIGGLLGIKKKQASPPVRVVNKLLSQQVREIMGDSFFIKSLGIKE
ncbi:MAG TPA: hypothetical protein VK941_09085, partial [Gillisia sp.]|nr:hypothetical protein [Gillisia sp.]